ncbi:MAG: hypothetical protein GPJ51_00785 [Candidatus Heimdallarchaeota archaeon]|nr:hypothetical protein [Candidatus Heimdallarchaeota archaeon]
MEKRLRTLIGALILTVTFSSAVVIGVVLPINSINIINEINAELNEFGQLNEDDLKPNDGTGSYSDWMFTDRSDNESRFYDQAFIEFYNVSDREGYLDYNTPISYYYVQGELVFDIVINKTVFEYNEEEDYVVFASRRHYIYNSTASTLFGNETVLNFNYMWPYYIENFGNGTEYGFQAYIASYLLGSEIDLLNSTYTYSEIAYAVLNRAYAESEGLVDTGTYLPHNWISVRPAFQDLDINQATSYKILYNATYGGKDYSVLTGDTGSAKFFLDLVRGLDYTEPDDLTVDVVQLLADIYDIDTPTEIESAKSFAAYMNYLLGRPSLDWLYDNKISYVCDRTAMEWVVGIEDPLLNGMKFPLLINETLSSSSIDLDKDIYYAEKLGLNNIEEMGSIIGIANLPYFHYSKSMDVVMEDNLAYVLEDGTDIKIVNTTDSLFRAIGQYGDYDGQIYDYTVIDGYIYALEGTAGLEILNATNPYSIDQITQWNSGNNDMRGVASVFYPLGVTPFDALVIANGNYGLKIASLSGDTKSVSSAYTFLNTSGIAIAVDARLDFSNAEAFVALGTDGIDVIDIEYVNDIELLWHYDSANFTNLKDVRDVSVVGNYLYVLDAIEGLLIFHIESNETLTEISQFAAYPGDEPFKDMYVTEDGFTAYLTQGSDGFMVVDISTKANPSEDYRFNGTDHLGTAFGIYAHGNDIYLADFEQGLVHLEFNYLTSNFDFVEKDELHTFVECWQRDSKVQFGLWDLGPDAVDANIELFNYTYDSFAVQPDIEKGLRLQWNQFFLRPFAYTSLTDSALFFDETVHVYSARSGSPYRQLDTYDLYWMHDANFINASFIQAGKWNSLYDIDLEPKDLFLTFSLPGQVGRDPFHMQTMMVEPVTGSVVGRTDRIQYNTFATNFIEAFSLLNSSKYDDPVQSLPIIHRYPTWHTTFPALPGGMATILWQEDVHFATEIFYDAIKEQFLDRIKGADASRTIGAFGSMFLVATGFVITSVVLNKFKPKEEIPDN